jgi:hypothetical protein
VPSRPSGAAPEGLAGMAKLAPLFPGGPGGAKPLIFTTHRPCQMCKKKSSLSCARDQVVIARKTTGADTPMALYRCYLVSKGRFTTSINVICVGIRSGLPKRRYRVVIDYAQGASSATAARQGAGCFVDYDSCANLGKRRVVCGFSWLLRVTDHEAALMEPKLSSSWVHRSQWCC